MRLDEVAFDGSGHGRQASLDGDDFSYPPGSLVRGSLLGRPVPCLSPQQQRLFRRGYEHRAEDHHDLAELDRRDRGAPASRPGGGTARDGGAVRGDP